MEFDRKETATYLASLLAKGAARTLQERAQGDGFAPGQFPVLLELWSGDGVTQKQLVDRLDIEQATLANTLSRMERDGLVIRKRHPSDRRARLIYLTDRAAGMRAAALAAAADAEAQLFRGFRRFERELFLEYMRMMLANIGRDPRG